jgi:hypothetical protein
MKGAMDEADPLSRRPNFVSHATVPLFWDDEVPSDIGLRQKSQPLYKDVQLTLMVVNSLRLSFEFADLVRKRYYKDSLNGDGGEWTKDSRIGAIAGYFWRLDRLCVPRNSELRLRFIFELHDNSLAGHIGVAITLVEALDSFRWKRIHQDVKDFFARSVMCRRAKSQPQMAYIDSSRLKRSTQTVVHTWSRLLNTHNCEQ